MEFYCIYYKNVLNLHTIKNYYSPEVILLNSFTMARNLNEIAKDIQRNWKNPYFGAKPYIQAMLAIHSSEPDAKYLMEDAEDLVRYFLANASTWRGPKAREIKSELKSQYNIK